MWNYQNTPECIKAILKFMQSKKKTPWLTCLNFINLEGRRVFTLQNNLQRQ